jgi:hypothetical protein
MNIGDAVKALKAGLRVRRQSWPATVTATCAAWMPGQPRYFVVWSTPGDMPARWDATQEDLFAGDWLLDD